MYNSLGQILEGDTKSGAVTLLTNTPVGQETYIAIQPRDPKVISTHFNYTFFFIIVDCGTFHQHDGK